MMWNDDLDESIFYYIKKSRVFTYAKDEEYLKTKIYMDET